MIEKKNSSKTDFGFDYKNQEIPVRDIPVKCYTVR